MKNVNLKGNRVLQPENLWDVWITWIIVKLYPDRRYYKAGELEIVVNIRNKKISIFKLPVSLITEFK